MVWRLAIRLFRVVLLIIGASSGGFTDIFLYLKCEFCSYFGLRKFLKVESFKAVSAIFLYCSIFPESYSIVVVHLLWGNLIAALSVLRYWFSALEFSFL